MRKIIVSEFLSLDGVMEAPEQWHFPFVNSELQAEINAGIHASDALLLGRITYEIFAGYWPTQTHNEFGIADKLNSQPKYVVSSTLEKVDWNHSTLIKGNIVEAITKLKQQPGGDISVTGSATLVQSLLQADLIDEYRLMIHPIVVGSGIRLFTDGGEQKVLKLIETKTFSSGVVILMYQVERQA